MTLTYRVSDGEDKRARDLIATMRSMNGRFQKTVSVLSIALLAGFLLWTIGSNFLAVISGEIPWPLLAVALVAVIFTGVGAYQKYRIKPGGESIEWTLTAGEEQLLLKSHFVESRYPWSSFETARAADGFVFLSGSLVGTLFIPPNGFPTAGDREAFLAMANRHLEKSGTGGRIY